MLFSGSDDGSNAENGSNDGSDVENGSNEGSNVGNGSDEGSDEEYVEPRRSKFQLIPLFCFVFI